MFLMMAIMLPAFLLAMYEKDGLPFEKVMQHHPGQVYLRPGCGPTKRKISMPHLRERRSLLQQSKKAKARRQKPEKHRALSHHRPADHPLSRCTRTGCASSPDGLYTKTMEYEDINYAVLHRKIRRPSLTGGARASTTLTAPAVPAFLCQPPQPPGQPLQGEYPRAGG